MPTTCPFCGASSAWPYDCSVCLRRFPWREDRHFEWPRHKGDGPALKWKIVLGQNLGLSECPYLRRWAIETPFGSLRLHHWLASDDDRALHDHPQDFITLVLSGAYMDVGENRIERMTRGMIRRRRAEHRHYVRVEEGGCWTLLFFFPERRKWGFWVGGKFRKANRYFKDHGHHPCERP